MLKTGAILTQDNIQKLREFGIPGVYINSINNENINAKAPNYIRPIIKKELR